jgi:hypothetical protein
MVADFEPESPVRQRRDAPAVFAILRVAWPCFSTLQFSKQGNVTFMNGTTPPPMPPPAPAMSPKTEPLAIWSLVLGIVSLVCCGILAAIPAVIFGHKALDKIKNSSGTLDGNGLAVGGLITGYIGAVLGTISIIGLLAAIAIPNFVKARDISMQNACINNLRQIQAAKQEWALENQKPESATPTENDLTPYFPDHKMPQCPAGGIYTIGAVTNPPTCSIPNHVLPQ